MSSTTIVYQTLTEAVFSRPRMYTLEGSFPEVIAFLEGYYSGAAKAKPDWEPVVEWALFEQWIARRLGVPETGVHAAFLKQHGENALPELKQLYSVFRRERSPETDSASNRKASARKAAKRASLARS